MSTFFKIAYQPYKWLIVLPFLVLITMVLGILCICAGLVLGQGRTVNMIAVIWAKLCCLIVPMNINIRGRNNYDPEKSYVVVSNHQSMADIPALLGHSGLTIKFVMKKELEKIPIFGTACHQLGCIYVDRRDHNAALASIQEAKDTMPEGASVLFFAEGTRTRDGELLPFKKGAFWFAKQMGLPILPVTVRDSMKILPSDSMDLYPGRVHIKVHPPVDISGNDIDNLGPAIQHTRDIIARGL